MTSQEKALQFQRRFIRRCGGLQLSALFAHLPGVAFFAKDEKNRFVSVNPPCLKILGCPEEWQALGKTDHDFFFNEMANLYQKQDREVMESRRFLMRCSQVVPDIQGIVRWYVMIKIPLRNRLEKVCGVAGAMYETREMGGLFPALHRLEPALLYIFSNFRDPIETGDLAKKTHLSERQFTRIFRQTMGQSPMQYVLLQRMQAACRELVIRDTAIGSIAVECGFYDQSSFTRSFRDFTGLTPFAYRKQNRHRLIHLENSSVSEKY
ncbi:MAG: helix-turn-helix domain-containing protein [Verrucomicrobiota bacterium]